MNVWLRETNSTDTLKDVETGEYNLGIIRFQSSSEGYYAQAAAAKGLLLELVSEYSLRLLMSKDHPLAGKKEIIVEDLLPYIEIAHGDGPSGRRENYEKKGRAPESPKRVYVFERGSQFDLLEEDPHTYMWVSPMPKELLRRCGLVERQCINIYQYLYTDIYFFTFVFTSSLSYNKAIAKNWILQGGLYDGKIYITERLISRKRCPGRA